MKVVGSGGRVEARGGDAPVLDVIGEIDMENIAELRVRLAAFRGSHVTIDLSQATFIDAAVRRALVAAANDGTHVSVTGATGAVRRALELAGMGELLV